MISLGYPHTGQVAPISQSSGIVKRAVDVVSEGILYLSPDTHALFWDSEKFMNQPD
jgi:hypothetical protein